MMSLEERVDRLEEENYFLRTQVRELDEALRGQQKQLDTLEKAIAEATGVIDRLRASIDLMTDGQTREQRVAAEEPPHYGKW